MLMNIIGNVGTGKTLFLTMLGTTFKKQIVSNYKLNYPYIPFDVDDFFNDKYDNSHLFLDEIYTYIDSRISGSEMNRMFSYKLFQARKNKIDIYGTLQLNRTIDIRYREMANRIVLSKLNEQRKRFEYIIMNLDNGKKVKKIVSFDNAQQYYRLYDTYQVIQPIDRKAINDERLFGKTKYQQIQIIANDIIDANKNQKITQGMVSLHFLKNEKLLPKVFQNDVYTYIHNELKIGIKSKKKTKKGSKKK